MHHFGTFGFLASFIFILMYIGIPLAVIFLLKWLYEIKKNSDLKVRLEEERIEQNKEIIQLLKNGK